MTKIHSTKDKIFIQKIILISILIFILVYDCRFNIKFNSENLLKSVYFEPVAWVDVMPMPISIEKHNREPVDLTSREKTNAEYIGTFDVSHYCLENRTDILGHKNLCGDSDIGCTGKKLTAYKSVAVPKNLLNSVLPVGSRIKLIYQNGKSEILTVEDTGGMLGVANRIDKAVTTHEEAVKLGVLKKVKIYKVR